MSVSRPERLGKAITYIEEKPCDAAIIDISIEDIRSRGHSFPILVLSIH